MFNKKGIAMEKLAIGVIIVVVLFIFLFYVIKSGIHAATMVDSSQCKSSIMAHSVLIGKPGESAAPDIYCPTQFYKLSSRDPEKIKRSLAETMRTAWETWGKGEVKLFNDEGIYCHIHSITEFKGEEKKIPGFAEYLKKTEIKTLSDDDVGVTYSEYLTGFASEKIDFDLLKKAESSLKNAPEINTSKKYATIFLYAKGEGSMKKFYKFFGMGSSTAGGVILGIGTAAIILVSAEVSIPTLIVGTAVTAIFGGTLGASEEDEIYSVAFVVLREYDAAQLKQMGCELSVAKQDRHKDYLG